SSVRGLIRTLTETKVLERDPTTSIKLRPLPRALPRTLSPKDIEILLAAIDAKTARGTRDRAMLELAYSCGLRVSELVSLELSQVNLTASVLITLGKGGKERIVPIGGPAVRALGEYVAHARP